MEFKEAVSWIMSPLIEGGYVNDPKDPGGETKYGISKRAYPEEDIENLTTERAANIYYRDYWCAAHCNDLSDNIRLPVFDCAINQGVGTAIGLLQQLVGVTVDHKVGPQTLARIAVLPNSAVIRYLTLRAKRYASSPKFDRYGNGWFNRLFLVAMVNAARHPIIPPHTP